MTPERRIVSLIEGGEARCTRSISAVGLACGGVNQLDDRRSGCIEDPALIQKRLRSPRPYCRHHVVRASIEVPSITFGFCQVASMHLAKSTEKAAVAFITDRTRDLLN